MLGDKCPESNILLKIGCAQILVVIQIYKLVDQGPLLPSDVNKIFRFTANAWSQDLTFKAKACWSKIFFAP
jgi:hypothetical protein